MRSRGAAGTLGGLMPLVDVLFLMLFALLVLSDTRSSNRAELVRVDLPAVEPAGAREPGTSERVALEIDADSVVRLASTGEAVGDRAALDRVLGEAVGDAVPEEVAVEVRADADARHGVAVDLLQHLRLRGFVHVELVALGRRDLEGPFGGTR